MYTNLPSTDTVDREKHLLMQSRKAKGKPKALYAPDYEHGGLTPAGKWYRKVIGLDPDKPLKPHEEGSEHLFWCRVRTTFQEPFAEFLGTLVLACFNNGAIAQATLGKGTNGPGGFGYGDMNTVAWGSGIGNMLGIYVGGDSGAYLNPAVTFANCMFRGLPWRRFPITVLSQFAGAFVGTLMVYAHYISALDATEGHQNRTVTPNPNATAGIWATYPQSFTTKASQAFGILLPAAISTLTISALKDDYNNGVDQAGGNFFPLSIFFLSYGINVAFGYVAGGGMNPALDLSGRAMSNLMGYPREVWTSNDYFFWMPLALPFAGCVLGVYIYDLFVYTGPSPVNSKAMGTGMLVDWKEQKKNKAHREEERHNPENQQV